jgi:hypothetical protein
MTIETTDLVDEVMTRWPAAIGVFLRNKMLCPGCPIGCFHSVSGLSVPPVGGTLLVA